MLSGETTDTNFIVFGLTRPGFETTSYRTRGEHAQHDATDTIQQHFRWYILYYLQSVKNKWWPGLAWCKYILYYCEKKIKQWWSSIPLISTKWTTTSHFNSLNTQKATTYVIGNPTTGFGQAQTYCVIQAITSW